MHTWSYKFCISILENVNTISTKSIALGPSKE